MIQTLVKPIYDSKDTIAEKQFIQTAETGDILLFYTKNTGAQLQRFITNSDFDHVAMVVKFGKNDLMVFQSNQMYGVSIYNWRQYIQYFDLYQKITIRKLEYIKKADVQRQLLTFVKKNLGKNYEINLSKLVTLESDVDWNMINKQKNKDRGYFCSELIAKAIKSVGLLDQKKSSSRYWPVDFAEKNGLLLKKGAYLGKEQVIILNKHLKNYI